MAVASSLTTQLVNKLNDNDVTLEKKLELCQVVFTSSTIPIIQKEDIVLDYIISCLKSDLGSNEKAKKDLFSCLKFCISSNRMKNFKGNLRPGVVDGVLQVISSENEICMNDTIIDILMGQYFQRWLCCDVPGLCLLLGSFFSKAKSGDCQDAIKVLGLFQHINRISLLKEEIKERFVEEVFEPLAFALSLFKNEELESFKSTAITTVVKILLSDMSFVNNFIIQMKLHSTESMEMTEGKDVKNFCSRIKKLPKNETVDNVSSAYTLFLEGVAQSDLQKESSDKVFQVFMLLCKPLGLRVDKMISVSISPVKNWTHEDSFKVIGDLICVLEKFNIPLDIDFETYTSQTWLISLVVGMTNINLDSLSPSLLTMIKNSFKYNNLIIETCIDTITNVMLRPKSQELIPFYDDLMKAVFEGSSKAQRFQKIVTLFLPKIKSVLNTFTLEVTLNEVFPCRVSEAFSDIVFSLAHSQVLAIMKSFLFHLERDCLDFINSSDTVVVTNFGIICKMLILMFNSVKIADHSTPDVIQEKFNNLMHDLEVLLGKFGTIFIDFHNDDLLKSYLDLCHSYGAMKLMMDDYNWNPMKKLTLPDNYPTNLTYVHSYLDPESWDAIANQTIKHECSAKFLIYKLLIQKIQAVSQVEEGEEGPGAQAARFILNISETAWLWDDIIALSSHFENKELIKLIRRLVHEAGSNQSIWKSVVSKEAFKENRRLVLATALRHLRKCAKILNETDDTLLPDVISYLNDETILEYELSILIIEDMELEENIKESLNNMVEVINNFLSKEKSCVLKKIPHQSFIEVIEQLPIHYMSSSSQNCLFLSILSLLVDLPQNGHVDNIIFDILFRIVSSIRKNKSEFHGSLDSGLVLKFLSDRSKNYPLRMKFLKKFCSVSLSNFYSAKKLIKSVSAPDRDTIWLTTMVLRSLLQYKNNDEDENKKQINTEKFINRLGSLCVSVLNTEKPHLSLLDDYTMSLAHCLSNESSELKSLLIHLPAYIQISMKNFNVGIELICQVIANKSEVEEYCVDNNMIKNTWNFLFEAEKLPNDSVIHLLLSKSSSSEFQIMLSLLNEKLENEIVLRREEFFSRIISLWSHVVTCGLNSEKSKIRQENIMRLVKPLVEIFAGWVETNFGVEPIFEFLTTLAQSSGVVIKPVVVDLYLLALSSVPLPSEDLKTLMANLSFAADALFALYLYRANLILDRLPVFLQRYRRFLYALVPCGNPNNDSTIILETTLCADKLERIAKAVGKRQKDLTRIAPYLVADLLDIFEKYQLHADIKLAYTNITYIFLNLCDNHGITYLEATLSPALFKSIHDNYKKYYRYVGKI